MTKNIYVLLGGIASGGIDGYATSIGLLTFAKQLAPFGNIKTYTWGNWGQVRYDIMTATKPGDKNIVIGFSGGGSRSTYLAFPFYGEETAEVDLMILWDPSPSWQMYQIYPNVKQVINFYNTKPMMWVPFIGSLGGGQVVLHNDNKTTKVTVNPIAIQHMFVQFSSNIHNKTLEYVKAL